MTAPAGLLDADARHQAATLQRELAARVERQTRLDPVSVVAGVDCAAPRFGTRIRAAIVLLSFPDLQVIERQTAEQTTPGPYIPGLLSFRELPVIALAWERLSQKPPLVFVDGQGYAHPRRLGIASHLGVVFDVPSIGVAKSVLIGEPRQEEPGPNPGDRLAMWDHGEEVAVKVRTKAGTKPLVISAGHRISLDDAVQWVLRCNAGYRLPEPTRQAHLAAGSADHE